MGFFGGIISNCQSSGFWGSGVEKSEGEEWALCFNIKVIYSFDKKCGDIVTDSYLALFFLCAIYNKKKRFCEALGEKWLWKKGGTENGNLNASWWSGVAAKRGGSAKWPSLCSQQRFYSQVPVSSVDGKIPRLL